ncbi:MAG: sigma-70 family RNA polymerase sigma factor [Gemmatimonadetes bacterium]|nr:sigma-70 family RNA polymerase sigma factor [Gemmatimonadota bacterium]MBI3081342.1 sigma-70 family RNA polymerase sigma factor [Gemmatimonadota bacterium]
MDWAVVYRETYADLVRFLHRKVWDPDQAQDLAQETFARALDHDPENPRAFVFTIAANLARDEARAAIRRKKHLTLMAGGAAEAGVAADAPGAAEEQERANAVRQALDQLSERDREVLLLWDAGFDYAEIARQTGLKPGAIGTTLARARRKLVEAHEALAQVAQRPQTKQR